jgi:alkylation response protein AidB-like acyl-CoA dehydrogenase
MEKVIFNEEITRAGAPELPNFVGIEMTGPVVMRHGTPDQQERWLPHILTGDERWCQGFSEPEAGSDLASLKTRAVKVDGGWRVTGQKIWTSGARFSKWCLLLVRTDQDLPRHKGITFAGMDLEQDGIDIRPLKQITGESDFNEVFYDEAFLPDENVIGGVNNGWNVAMTTLSHERAGTGFQFAVTVRKTLDELVAGCAASGAIHDPWVRDHLAQFHIEVENVRLNSMRALTSQIKYGTPGPEGSLPKWQFSEVDQAITTFALDVLGPESLDDPSFWTHEFLQSRGDSIMGGTSEIQKGIIAERVLGLPKARRS